MPVYHNHQAPDVIGESGSAPAIKTASSTTKALLITADVEQDAETGWASRDAGLGNGRYRNSHQPKFPANQDIPLATREAWAC